MGFRFYDSHTNKKKKIDHWYRAFIVSSWEFVSAESPLLFVTILVAEYVPYVVVADFGDSSEEISVDSSQESLEEKGA